MGAAPRSSTLIAVVYRAVTGSAVANSSAPEGGRAPGGCRLLCTHDDEIMGSRVFFPTSAGNSVALLCEESSSVELSPAEGCRQARRAFHSCGGRPSSSSLFPTADARCSAYDPQCSASAHGSPRYPRQPKRNLWAEVGTRSAVQERRDYRRGLPGCHLTFLL